MTARPPAAAGTVGRVFVWPNWNAGGLGALLLAMWYAGASQNNGAAYLLGFVLAGFAAVSALHAVRNLRGLRLTCGPIAPVFVGEKVRVHVFAQAPPDRAHFALRIGARSNGELAAFPEIRGDADGRAELAFDAPFRGLFPERTFYVSSLYPLGFFTVRRRFTVAQPHCVYPACEGSRPLPAAPARTQLQGIGARLEGDDFAGLRAYQTGEPQRHIDWKAVARGRGLMIKQWAGEIDDTLALTWEHTAGLAYEARVSQLAKWVVLAERGGRNYGLTVPGATLAPDRGPAHFHDCLRTLALFPKEAP